MDALYLHLILRGFGCDVDTKLRSHVALAIQSTLQGRLVKAVLSDRLHARAAAAAVRQKQAGSYYPIVASLASWL